MKFSKSFIELFGTLEDLKSLKTRNESNELTTILSVSYPTVTVPIHFRNELDMYVKQPSKSNSVIFRRLISNLLPNHVEWAIRNAKQMLVDYNIEISAAFGNLIKNLLNIF